MSQQTIKNFKINFNKLNERNTFSCGDLITGNISFDLTKETKISSITMELTGKASVQWIKAETEDEREKQFSAEMDLLDVKSVIMRDGNAVGGTNKLQPGTHVYPFTCQLPQGNFPSTFHGVHGHIVYTLKVSINRPWHVSKDFVTELNFVERIDTNQPELRAPLSGSNGTTPYCLWCASGPITMTVSVEKKAFTPGETARIICEFSNPSFKRVTPRVELQQRQTFYTINRNHQIMAVKALASVTRERLKARTSDVHSEIMLTIPSSASLSISNCSILDVEYIIEVNLRTSAGHDVSVLVPITVCDTPVHTHPPPSLTTGFYRNKGEEAAQEKLQLHLELFGDDNTRTF